MLLLLSIHCFKTAKNQREPNNKKLPLLNIFPVGLSIIPHILRTLKKEGKIRALKENPALAETCYYNGSRFNFADTNICI